MVSSFLPSPPLCKSAVFTWLCCCSFCRYCVVFDPLDGSSNIDCGVSIGTVRLFCMSPQWLLFFCSAINLKHIQTDLFISSCLLHNLKIIHPCCQQQPRPAVALWYTIDSKFDLLSSFPSRSLASTFYRRAARALWRTCFSLGRRWQLQGTACMGAPARSVTCVATP